jgi:putative phosphoribosyl transferase
MPQPTTIYQRPIHIPAGESLLDGDLSVPESVGGVVLFAHGSGSSRHSPRNRNVAQALQRAGLATLLMDLLTPQEETLDARTTALRFDVNLLARRLIVATWWLLDQPQTEKLPIGYFGASTGAAAALVAAAAIPEFVAAIVSRGGRPDLAGEVLHKVAAPTLLVVGKRDTAVLELNRKALAELRGRKRLEIVPGATHLFEEPGALQIVTQLAANWFTTHLTRAASQTRAA